MQVAAVRGKVRNFIEEHGLLQPGAAVVVAYSGGADSAALLDILANLTGYGLVLVVAHLNHQLRGEESDADEVAAAEVAERYGCRFVPATVNVAVFAAEQGVSLEEAAREARYEFLKQVAAQHGAAVVAVGHHKGDQAETLLMRLIRGAGGSGLSGMLAKNSAGWLVRPLLCLNRQEIEVYLKEADIPWREDSSNADTRFLRNRVRHELLPQLAGFNPGIVELLNQTAEILAADEAVLDNASAVAFTRATTGSDRGVAVDLSVLSHEPVALRRRIYRKAIESVKGDLRRITFGHLAAIDKLAFCSRPNSRLALPDGVTVIRAYDRLRFAVNEQVPIETDFSLSIEGPGLYRLPCGATLLVEECAALVREARPAGADRVVTVAGQLQYPLTVRYYRHGDRFVPLGMQQHKKLKNLFIDRKIPLVERGRIPLLVDRGEIVWVCGVQPAERLRVTAIGQGASLTQIIYTEADRRL